MAKTPTGKSIKEPYWEPLARQHLTLAQTASIVVRHLIPLAGIVLPGSLAGEFLILSVFSIAFSIVGIGTTGVMVSTRKEVPAGAGIADQAVGWILAIVLALVGSVLLTAMFGWVIAVFTVSSGESLFDGALLGSAALIVVAAAPGMVRQYRDDLASSLTEEQRKQRDQPIVLGLVMSAGLIFIMSGYAPDVGRFGLLALAFAVTALFIFRDLRPDLMRELTRPSNRPPRRH